MKIKLFILLSLAFSGLLFALNPENFIDDRGKFLSESERNAYSAIALELYQKTGFALYLYTAEGEVPDATALADSLCANETGKDSLRALILIDGNAKGRAFRTTVPASRWISSAAAERLAQKFLLPEFRREAFGHGILVFEAEVAKNVARLNDVRLQSPMPRPTKDGIPAMAWFLIVVVLASVIIAYAYFVRQGAEAKKRGRIREFGGFPHQGFNSGFGD